MGMLGQLMSMSKYCFSTSFDEKLIRYSTSIGGIVPFLWPPSPYVPPPQNR
jgi:hypothetical protein